MARTFKGNLTGKAAQGKDDIYSSADLPQSRATEIHDEVAEQLQHNLAEFWASHVAPVDVDKFNLAMQFISLQESVDPRTPAQQDADEQDADWQAQVSGMRS